ncbi:MAG: AAA family ATPase [Cetobacterium sp.]|uniref:AAA family ATPase n=1 Tax=Cetobacterium sp. TaxID=2071632 RepID=UPI003F3B1838
MFKNNRISSKVNDALSKGHNLIYFFGEASLLNDKFFYNINRGLLNIQDTLKYYFLEESDYDYFIVYNSQNQYQIFDSQSMDKDGISLEDFATPPKKNKFFANSPKNPTLNSEDKKQINNEVKTTREGYETLITQIEKKLKDKTIKIALYLDSFEYSSNLYKDPDLAKIQSLDSFYQINNLTTVISMKNPIERLKEFDIKLDIDSPGLINISYPNSSEVFNSFVYLATRKSNIDFNIELLDISDNLTSTKLTLNNAINILKKVLKESEELSLNSFKKFLNKNIHEKVTFDDVILPAETKERLQKAIEPYITNNSKPLKKGVILTGPPGTGKTFLVKALANENNMFFKAPSLAELKGEYIGESGANVKRLFEELRNNQPSILFLDELDSLFSIRGSRHGDSYTNDIVNQFLVEIDGVNTGKQKIFIVGATNRMEVIDSAIKSRLNDEILIPLPNFEMRERIFNSKFTNFKIKNLNNFKENFQNEFIEKTEGFSGRDIDEFVKSLKLSKPNEEFNEKDFNDALKNTEEKYKNNFKRIMENSIEEIKIPDKVEIIGYRDILKNLEKECAYITCSLAEKKRYKNFNIKVERGSILYGPPGNGKTALASYIAHKHNFYLIRILSKSFASLSFENSLNKIKEIFENTIKLANITSENGILLFFDEIDTLIGKNLDPQVRGTLLDYLQDQNGIRHLNSKIMFLGATNFFENLDEASIRSGRIDRKLFIDNPSIDSYSLLLQSFWRNDKTIILDLDLDSNILGNLIDKFIVRNFESKNGLDKLYPLFSNELMDIKEIFKFRISFQEKNEENKIIEIKSRNANIYSISDIQNLANSIKIFAFENSCLSDDGKKLLINDNLCKEFISKIFKN